MNQSTKYVINQSQSSMSSMWTFCHKECKDSNNVLCMISLAFLNVGHLDRGVNKIVLIKVEREPMSSQEKPH